MAKTKKHTKTETRAAAKAERKPEEKRPYTLMDCMKLGRIANILFVVFIVFCLIYYYSFSNKGKYIIPFELIAYFIEASAFAFFTLSVVWLDRLVRARTPMKVLLIVYIVAEVILMLLEFQFLPWTYYNGLSLALTITHVIFSTAVSFSLLMLDPQNKRLQIIIFITSTIILAGMFLGLAGYRVYASMLLNAFAYIFFYSAMLHQLHLEEMNIDCYGDRAESTSFTSTMFADSPLLVERPEQKPLTLRERAKKAADQLRSDEQVFLTDEKEAFEYEFGVQEDDEYEDDEYEDDEYEDDEEDDADDSEDRR